MGEQHVLEVEVSVLNVPATISPTVCNNLASLLLALQQTRVEQRHPGQIAGRHAAVNQVL